MLLSLNLYSQPADFSWDSRHYNSFNYITPVKDQKEQGPCHVFASVAAVEAMAHIFYNKSEFATANLDLSERQLYTIGGCGMECTASDVKHALVYIRDNGIIDNDSYPFKTQEPYCASDCFESYRFTVTIPGLDSLETISCETDLKKAIMDYGPIIVRLPGEDSNGKKASCILHPGGDCVSHSILVVGWRSQPFFEWNIKDSWAGAPSIEYKYISFSL